MKKTLVGLIAGLWLVGCSLTPPPHVTPPPPGPPALNTLVFDATNDSGAPVVGVARVDEVPAPVERHTDGAGHVEIQMVPGGRHWWFLPDDSSRWLPAEGDVAAVDPMVYPIAVRVATAHVDPSVFTLGELARIRGAMWPRANVCADPPLLPYGPRPGQPSNIIGTPYFDGYSSQQQNAIARCLTSVGYTNVVVGGVIDQWAYHGQFVAHDYSTPEGFERFLDIHQWFYDHGLRPITFWHVDGATYEETEALAERLIAHNPRAQRLIRIFVPAGWEPTRYDWSSVTWAKYAALGRRVLPNALILLHTVSDTDAPVGTDALYDDNGKGNGPGWARVVPFLHGWLIQNGPYETGPQDDPATARSFAGQFLPDGVGAETHGAMWHFKNGIAGWPTGSAWGEGIPICLYAAEHTAFNAYWRDRPDEPRRQAWGDLAIASGACGYLEGGTVDVPARRP